MAAELKILFVEDLPTDVELAKRTLSKEGIVFQARVVDTEADFLHELEKFSPDIIISDYKMPKFNGMRALNLTLEKCPSTPFILLTGSVNEEIAVECMKSGATDYIIKEHIARLPMAVKDALEKNKIIFQKEKAELELIKSEERLRITLEETQIGTFDWDLKNDVFYVSPTYYTMLGYKPKEGPADRSEWLNRSHPDDKDIVTKKINDALNGIESKYQYEVRIKHADGSYRWINVIGHMIKGDKNNKPTRIIGVRIDITERKGAEEKLRQNEDRYRDLVENSSDLICTHDLDGNILSVNSAALKITGYSQEEVLKMNMQNIIVQEYRKIFNAYLNKIQTVGHAHGLMIIQTKTGERRIWEYHNSLRTQGIDKPIVRGMVQDVTDRKHAEESLLKLKKAVDNSGEVIFLTDKQGIFSFVNHAFTSLYGFTADEIIGKVTPRILKSGLLEENHYKQFWETLRGRKEVIGELVNRRKDGTLLYVDSSATPILDDKKNIIGFLGIQRDISERKRMEVELRKSEAELKEAQRVGRLGSWDWDATTDTITWSEEYYRIYGFDPRLSPPGYEEHLNIYTRESATLLDAAVKKSMQTGEEYQLDLELARADSTTRWVTAHGEVKYDVKGQIVGLRGTAQDITERKRAEEALLESEEKFRNLASSAKDSIIMMDDEGKFFYWNEAFEKLFQYKSSEITGKVVHALIAPKRFHDDYEKGFAKYLETGEGPAVGKVLELAAIKKNGEEFPIELSLSTFMLRGKRMFLGILRDIYERKHAEEEIVMLAHSLRSINECVSITDIEDKILFVNESFLKTYGYDESELIGKQMSIVRSLNNPPELVKEILPTTLLGGWQGELWNKRKDGSEFQISLSTTIIRDKSGEAIALIGVATDITERKRAEKELINAKDKAEEMSRLKSNFLANMSHELRTPLNGIMGYADILSSQINKPELIEMAQGIYQSGKRLSETLNFILDLSEAETDRIEVIAKDIAVIPIVKNSINSFAKEAAERNLQLETIIKEENIFVHLDEHLFSRILHNLLDNAIKFTNKGGIIVEIGKEITSGKDWLSIKIKDTGIGIAEDKIDLIWDEFRQVSEGLTRSYEGAGLGLTISKKAVELMQGNISVESELGVGSTFTVKFPAVSVLPQIEKVVKEKQAAVIQPEKEKVETTDLPLVLCVEDDFVNRNIVKLFLKNICRIETAEDGETALQLAAEKKYDLVLMDINLGGGMNGLEVVQEILKMPQYFNTPIIAVTAYAMGKDKTEFIRGGCTHYISKPFQKHELIDLVSSVLKNN